MLPVGRKRRAMNNIASKLRNSASKVAIAIDHAKKKRLDKDPDTIAGRLTRESRARVGKRDSVDVDKLGAKLSKMPKVDQKTIRAVEARLSPVEAGQLARVRDAKPTTTTAARAVNPADAQPTAADLKKITAVEAGDLARVGGDVKAYAAAKQTMTPVQKGEFARMLDVAAANRALPTARALTPPSTTATPTNLTAGQPNGAAPLTLTPYSATNEGNAVTPTSRSLQSQASANGDGFTLSSGGNSPTGNATAQVQFKPVFGDGSAPPPPTNESQLGILGDGDNPFNVPGVGDSNIILGDGDYTLGTPVPGGTEPEGLYNITIADQLVDDSPHVKTPTGQFDTANGFSINGTIDASKYPTPEEYRQQFNSSPRESQNALAHPDDYYDFYRSINPQYDPDGTEWRDQGPIALAPPQELIDKAHGELTAGGNVDALTSLFANVEPHIFGSTPPLASDAPANDSSGVQAFQSFLASTKTTNPEEQKRIAEQFRQGAERGAGEAVLETAEGVAKLALSTVQYVADSSKFGYAGDELRGVTGKLPTWLDAFIPSHARSQQTDQYTGQLAENIGAYAVSRAQAPEKLKEDFQNFVTEKWDELKPEYEAAKAQGPEAEAKWWGELFGRATVETAMTVVTAADVIKVGEATAGLAKLAIDAGVGFTAEKATEVSKYLKNLAGAAETAGASDELSVTSLNEMEEAQARLAELKLFEGDDLLKTPEGRKILAEIEATEAKLESAIDRGYSISAPGGAAGQPKVHNIKTDTNYKGERVASGTGEFKDVVLIYGSYRGSEAFQALDPKNEVHTESIKLTPHGGGTYTDKAVTVTDVHNLTDATGTEYALFQKEVADPNGGPPKIISYIVRGDENGIILGDKREQKLIDNGFKLIVHSHVSRNINDLKPSDEDYKFLNALGQQDSLIVNRSGRIIQYNKDGTYNNANNINNEAEFKKSVKAPFERDHNYVYSGTNSDGKPFNLVYSTNQNGQVEEVRGNLVDKGSKKRNTGSTGTRIGHTGIKGQPYGGNDIGFHLVGDQFLGPDSEINFIAGNEALNNGAYKNLETKLREATKKGQRVEVRIELKYSDDPNAKYPDRPTEIVFNYNIYDEKGQPGRWVQESFENKNPADVKKKPPKRQRPAGDDGDGGGKKPKPSSTQPPRELASSSSAQPSNATRPLPFDTQPSTAGKTSDEVTERERQG